MSLLVNFKSSKNLQRLPYFDLVYIDMSGENSNPVCNIIFFIHYSIWCTWPYVVSIPTLGILHAF